MPDINICPKIKIPSLFLTWDYFTNTLMINFQHLEMLNSRHVLDFRPYKLLFGVDYQLTTF